MASRRLFDGATIEIGQIPVVGPAVAENTFWLKVSGLWKQAVMWIKVSGEWKQTSPKIKVNGSWK